MVEISNKGLEEKIIDKLKIRYIVPCFIIFAIGLLGILFELAFRLGDYISINGSSFPWIMSSIYQGLFPILAFCGVVIIYRTGLMDGQLEKWEEEIRDKLIMLHENKIIKNHEHILLGRDLDRRHLEDFSKKLPSEDVTEKWHCCESIREIEFKIDRMKKFMANRNQMWNVFKLPLFHGCIVIVFSIALLLSPSFHVIPSLIPNWNSVTMVWMVILSAVVITEVIYTLLFAIYRYELPRSIE